MANNEKDALSGETPAPPYTTNDQNIVPQPEAVYHPHPQPAYNQEPSYVVPLWRLQDQPELVDCPFCHRRTKTRVDKQDSAMTFLAGGLLCLCCICLACLPCMLGWAQNVTHLCGACGKQLVHKSHDGVVQITEEAKIAQAQESQAPFQNPAGTELPSQK